MLCKYCGGATKVMETSKLVDEVYRRRKCVECGKISYTVENDCDDNTGELMIRQRYTKYTNSGDLS